MIEGAAGAPAARSVRPASAVPAPQARRGADGAPLARPALLVFALLCCLFACTAGGQGYSVDGTFSYNVATSIATDPQLEFLRRNAGTLQRWGPVGPLLGVPFTWLGARLAALAPARGSVPVDGAARTLHDWEPIGAPAAIDPASSRPAPAELFIAPLPVPASPVPASSVPVHAITVVSFLSLASAVPEGVPVAELLLQPAAGAGAAPPPARAVLRAGIDTAEWAYDVPGAARPAHGRARVAGHWPGNPEANLYVSRIAVDSGAAAGGLVVRYVAPQGRLHLRSVTLHTAGGDLELPGPASWSAGQQRDLFTRFGFSFLNVPFGAAACALLLPLSHLLGYSRSAGAALALGAGAGSLLWPYAKLDFAEPIAAAFAVAATALVFAAFPKFSAFPAASAPAGVPPGLPLEPQNAAPSRLPRLGLLAGAGVAAAAAAGAKYTAAWFLPLLAVQIALLCLPAAGGRYRWSALSRALAPVAAFLAPAAIALAVAVALAGRLPTIWTGWRGGLERGWLDFPLWAGLYGLLLSPGKSVLLYAPVLLLALFGAAVFARRHRRASFIFYAVPVTYLLVFGSKAVWHGGGWGPRYLVPALPFAAVLALPVLAWLLAPLPAPPRGRAAARALAVALLAAGAGMQLLGVLKHPNLYGVMFRDHIAGALPRYGAGLGGPPAETYWRHFGGPGAYRQLSRPPAGADPSAPLRGLGYLYAETGPLEFGVRFARSADFDLTLYLCDWDRQGRRQRLVLETPGARFDYAQDYDFAACEFLSWPAGVAAGDQLRVRVEALAHDVPVVSALFFDPPGTAAGTSPGTAGTAAAPRRAPAGETPWPGRLGRDGYVLFAWSRGEDVARLPAYVAGYGGGDRVWLDTGEAELTETALLYAPGFSPLLGHAWLLGADAVGTAARARPDLLQRALGSPPWRYVHGLELHAPHPEYGLGLDLWPLLLRAHFRSHGGFMAAAWAVWLLLGAGAAVCGLLLARSLRLRDAASPPGAGRLAERDTWPAG